MDEERIITNKYGMKVHDISIPQYDTFEDTRMCLNPNHDHVIKVLNKLRFNNMCCPSKSNATINIDGKEVLSQDTRCPCPEFLCLGKCECGLFVPIPIVPEEDMRELLNEEKEKSTMKTIIKPRQAGKTHDLILISAETGYPIITKSVDSSREIINRAKKMNLNIPDPLTIYDIMNTKRCNSSMVLVDDAEFILNIMIREMSGAQVDTIAIAQRNEKGHELTIYGEDLNEKYGLDDDPNPVKAKGIKPLPLTQAQMDLLIKNNIACYGSYFYMGIYTKNEIDNPTKTTTMKKFMKFKNQFSGDEIEIEVNIDELISEVYCK